MELLVIGALVAVIALAIWARDTNTHQEELESWILRGHPQGPVDVDRLIKEFNHRKGERL